MVNFSLMFIVIIGVLQVSQVCKAIPIKPTQANQTKLFSASEQQRAKSAVIDTIEADDDVDFANKFCDFLVPDYKPAANYSNAEQIHFNELAKSIRPSATLDEILFVRTSICAYLSQPPLYESEARSFGLQLVPYMKFRFLKLENRNASGVERVHVAEKLCCVYQGRDNSFDLMNASTLRGLPEEELSKFDQRWNEYETTNASKSFDNVCDFLRSINPSNNCGSDQ